MSFDVYAPNNRAVKYLKQKQVELRGNIDLSAIVVRDSNISLSTTDGTTRQKISKNIENSIAPSTNKI